MDIWVLKFHLSFEVVASVGIVRLSLEIHAIPMLQSILSCADRAARFLALLCGLNALLLGLFDSLAIWDGEAFEEGEMREHSQFLRREHR